MMKALAKCALLCTTLTVLAAANLYAQDEKATIDRSQVPAKGVMPEAFVPGGWKIEEQVRGDLNGDGESDIALKLIQDKQAANKDEMNSRDRALLIIFSEGEDNFRLAAINDTLLQCTSCGGAFYGFVDAPANVSIKKGILIVQQDHGSRDVTDTTYRFRYDEQPSMFILIGFDYATRDRATGSVWTESTNFLTGKRVTYIGKGKKSSRKTTTVAKKRMSLEEVDGEKMDEEATLRLGLG